MSKLLVLNSFGPMGSTLLAGLLEKLGFTNVPLRKLQLHQYLMGEVPLDSGLMQRRLRENLDSHSRPLHSGGVSIVDRGSQPPRALTDINRVRERLGDLHADSVSALYYACRNLYCDAVTYKPVDSRRDWHIEMTVDIHRFDPEALVRRYRQEFDDVRMIHLHRPFTGWINSLASQAMAHPELKNRIIFFPHMRHADYRLYDDMVNRMPGLHVQFDELFDTPIEKLAADMAAFMDVPLPALDWRNASYDLYGKFQPYDIAFTRFDDKRRFLADRTLAYLGTIAGNDAIKRPLPRAAAWLRYLGDMRAYRRENGLGLL